jgi:hypothetical protein
VLPITLKDGLWIFPGKRPRDAGVSE